MKCCRSIELAEIGEEVFWRFQRLPERFLWRELVTDTSKGLRTYEFDNLWHLDLREDAFRNVVSKSSGVADSKRIWTLDRDFPRLAAIELFHSLHFCESHKHPILETMSSFVEAGHQSFFFLRRS